MDTHEQEKQVNANVNYKNMQNSKYLNRAKLANRDNFSSILSLTGVNFLTP